MSFSPVFQENLLLLERFEPVRALEVARLPLTFESVGGEGQAGWYKGLQLNDISSLIVYGISPLGEDYLALRPWLRENPARMLVFLIDNFNIARTFLETSVATEALKNQQVVIKLFKWPENGQWGEFSRDLEWMFKTICLGKVLLISRSGATAEEENRARQLKPIFQCEIEDWLRTYHSYLNRQKEAFESYYLNLLELLNAKFGQEMAGDFKDIPAIICGAGPSLALHLKKLHSLQDRALIFAAGSAVNVLSRHGVLPHFGGCVDSTPTQVSRLSTNFAFQTPFFYLNRFNHQALRFLQGEKLFARGGIRLNALDWFDEQLGLDFCERVPSSVSSSNFCFEIALILGCNPIIFVGMDLCYKDDVHRYAPGVTAHPAGEQRHHEDINKRLSGVMKGRGVDGKEVTTTWNWTLEANCFSESRKQHPEINVWNATEGGMPIEGIANVPFQDVIDRMLKKEYPLDERVHTSIQRHGLEFITKEKLYRTLTRWKDSLVFCKEVLSERFVAIQAEMKALTPAAAGLPMDHFQTDLEKLLGGSPAYTHCLKQLNNVFDGLNAREYFRITHYPEIYPLWKRLEVSSVIESTRCNFLIEKIDSHLSNVQVALDALPAYPMLPRSNELPAREILVERYTNDNTQEEIIHEYYLTGELYAIKRKLNGLLHGSQDYFYVDGMPKSVFSYSEGVLDGEVRLYYPAGHLKRLLHFSKGQLEGEEKLWDESGVLLSESSYHANSPVGTIRTWHKNGTLARETEYDAESGSSSL